LIHGQVIEAWLPQLKAGRVLVVDEIASNDSLMREAFSMVMPAGVELVVCRPSEANYQARAGDAVRTVVLFRDVPSVVAGRKAGLPNGDLNLGNLHAGAGKSAFARSVFLGPEDIESLRALEASGMKVKIQAVPSEPAIDFTSILDGR
jgi:PTS system mannose-specific IIB component